MKVTITAQLGGGEVHEPMKSYPTGWAFPFGWDEGRPQMAHSGEQVVLEIEPI